MKTKCLHPKFPQTTFCHLKILPYLGACSTHARTTSACTKETDMNAELQETFGYNPNIICNSICSEHGKIWEFFLPH